VLVPQSLADCSDWATSAAPPRDLSFFREPHLIAALAFAATLSSHGKINRLRREQSFARLNL
jgi:hypothetical protein